MPITVSTGIQYIDINEFTSNVVINENNEYYPVTGNGIFDDLMETATKHLLAQYKANRIRGENFATAYAHIYEVTLQAALSIWLQKPEQAAKVELLNAQTEHEYVKIDQTKEQTKLIIEQQALTHEQTAHEISKRLNTEQQTLLLIEQTAHEISKRLNTEQNTRLLTEHTALAHEQTLHETSKRLNTEAQTTLINTQNTHEQKKILNTEAQTALINAQTLHEASKKLNTEAQTQLINSQKLHTDAQTTLTTNQATHELSKKANTEADTILKESQSINVRSDTELKEKQVKSVAVEPLIKLAQAEYYKAQTKSTNKDEEVKEAQINSENMKSNLYQRQIEGYDENYKEKILKILLDAFTVVFSVASEGFKGGLPKVLTVSGINDLSDIITNDLNIPRTNATISTMTNTSNPTPSDNPLSDHHNTTVPESYSNSGWDNEGGNTYHEQSGG